MAKQAYIALKVEGTTSSILPPGLECAGEDCITKIALYLVDESDPTAELLDLDHADVFLTKLYGSRRVSVLIVDLLKATWKGDCKWEFHVEYDETALLADPPTLNVCDVCQLECLTCEVQAKLTAFSVGGEAEAAEWLQGYEAFLTLYPDLDFGDLPSYSTPS